MGKFTGPIWTDDKELAVYLKHHGMISYERLQELYQELFGVVLSQGSLVYFVTECSKRIAFGQVNLTDLHVGFSMYTIVVPQHISN